MTMHTKNLRRAALLVAIAAMCAGANAAVKADQSPAGDGWQLLAAPASTTAAAISASSAAVAAAPISASSAVIAAPIHASLAVGAAVAPASAAHAASETSNTAAPSMNVAAVVLPSEKRSASAPLTFILSPQDSNLRNALDRWLQLQGWQLAWRIDDDLPLEFNAVFTGDFTSILQQVMQATNNMRTPARVCRHTNNVIRVIARGASCKD
jgi:Toxin co-regulated pilus biosynthesis protein Q